MAMTIMYLVTGSSNNGWEHSSWGVIPSETGLAHSGAIVDYKRGYVVVTHVDILRLKYLHKHRDLVNVLHW